MGFTAVTILDGKTEIVDLLDYRLKKSVEQTMPCDVCGERATRLIVCEKSNSHTFRCEAHGGMDVIDMTRFIGLPVRVEILGQRHWLTYINGKVIHESRGQ